MPKRQKNAVRDLITGIPTVLLMNIRIPVTGIRMEIVTIRKNGHRCMSPRWWFPI